MLTAGAFAAKQLSQDAPRLLRENMPRPEKVVGTATPDKPLCVKNVLVPKDTAEMRFWVAPGARAGTTVRASVTSNRGAASASMQLVSGQLMQSMWFERPTTKAIVNGNLCFRVDESRVKFLGASQRLTATKKGEVIRLSFFRATAPSVYSQIGNAIQRAALFRPAWVGPWTFYALALLVFFAFAFAIYALIRHGRGGWSTARWLALIAFVVAANGLTWSVVTPPFHAPDEYEHFAYIDTLAERGMPHGNSIGAYTDRFSDLLDTTVFGVALYPQSKPPWFKSDEAAWLARDRVLDIPNAPANHSSSAAQYAPIFYAAAVVPYKLGGSSLIGKNWAVRMFALLMTIAAAMLAFLTARELAPGLEWFAPIVGLVAAFEPMFLHIGSSAHVDAMVTMLMCALLYVVARVMKRGLTLRLALLAGGIFALNAAVKPSGLAVAPALLLAAFFVVRKDPRPTKYPLRELALGALLAAVMIGGVAAIFQATAETAGNLASGGATASPNLTGLASFTWQWFFPRLDSMFEWYGGNWYSQPVPLISVVVPGFIANFNHLDTAYPFHFYRMLANLFIMMGIATLVGAWRYRKSAADWFPYSAFAVTAIAGMFALLFVSAYLLAVRSNGTLIQGRYLLQFITIAGLFVAVSSYSVSKRWGIAIATSLVVCLGLLNLISYGLSLERFYL